MQQHTQRARGGKPYLHTASKCFPTHFLTPLHAWSVVTFHSLLSGGTRQRAPKRSATLLSATSPGSAAAAAGRESTLPAARRQRLPQPRSPHPGCTEPLPALQARATLLRGPQPRRCGRSAPRRARRGGHGRGVGASRRTAGRGAPRPSRNKAGPPPCRPRSLPTPRRRPRGRTGGIRPLAARPAADTAAGQPCSRLRLPPPRPQNGAGTGGAPPRRDGGSRRTETPRHRHRRRLASLPARLSLSPPLPIPAARSSPPAARPRSLRPHKEAGEQPMAAGPGGCSPPTSWSPRRRRGGGAGARGGRRTFHSSLQWNRLPIIGRSQAQTSSAALVGSLRKSAVWLDRKWLRRNQSQRGAPLPAAGLPSLRAASPPRAPALPLSALPPSALPPRPSRPCPPPLWGRRRRAQGGGAPPVKGV